MKKVFYWGLLEWISAVLTQVFLFKGDVMLTTKEAKGGFLV